VFNIDIEASGRCGGSVKVIACIENQLVQTGVCLTSGTSRFDVHGRPGNQDAEKKPDKIANLSGSATRSQEKICSQHPLNNSILAR
jgi:hypothetical protein